MATRIAYAFILLINSILSWIMLTPWAIKKLEHLTLDYMTFDCGESGQCYGYFAVQRINFALAVFHFFLAFLLLGVRSTKDGRSALQNGFWGPKIIVWLALVVISFLIPEGFFLVWGNYFAFVGAMLFVLLGLILLVDLAHTWAEMCLAHIEQEDSSRLWRGLLIGSTLGMYGASIAMTIVMYIYFAASGCSMNISAITLNLLLFIIISFISVQPAIQESNPRAGLAQAAMVTVYCTYLTLSAVAMEPDDKHCNPLIRARGARTTTIVLGAIVTMLTIAYTTTRAATQGFAMGTNRSNAYAQLAADDYEHSLITQQPTSHRQMRAEALQAAVASGALPASALDEDDDSDDEDNAKNGKDDERNGTQYNYSLFHLIFLMATCWVATLLTQGISPESASSDFAPIGRTYWASWIKIVSAWLCYAIYAWTVVAPSVLSDREF
jgi:hypothetical protein